MQGLLGMSFGVRWRVIRIPGVLFLLRVPEELRNSRERVIFGVFGLDAVSCLLLLERCTVYPFWSFLKMR